MGRVGERLIKALLLSALLPVSLLAGATVLAANLDTPRPQQFSVLDGLPSNGINDIAEDRQGYLWIATRDGLARYDGVGFRVWRVDDGLRENHVWSVHVDAQDRVWIGTKGGGLSVLDADRRGFLHYTRRSHPQMLSDSIWSIATDAKDALWFGTEEGGAYRLRPGGGMDRFLPDPDDPGSLPSAEVTVLQRDPKGVLWVGTRGGAAYWTGRSFQRVPLRNSSTWVDAVTFDDTGRTWFGGDSNGGGVRLPDGRTQEIPFQDPVRGGAALKMLLQDRQGSYWLDTRSGLARSRNGVVYDVPLYSNTSRGLVRPSWSMAYEDREGGLWFASSDLGLWHLPANWRDFSLLTRRIDDPRSPANSFVHGVAPARNGGLWLVGSGGALDMLDPQTGRIDHVLQDLCGDNLAASVLETSDGGIWIGCIGGLVRVDPHTRGVTRWSHDDATNPALPERIKMSAELADGTLWFSDVLGAQARDLNGRVLEQVRSGDGRGLPAGTWVRQLASAPDGGLWLAGNHGLSMWNAGARRFEPVPGAPREPLAGFALASGDRVWIAGMGKLSEWQWSGARLRHLRSVDESVGIPMVMPSGILIDGSGSLWLSSMRGLVRYDPARNRVRVYGIRDGLPSQEFSDSPIQLSPQGYVALGTADGLVLFHPRQVLWSDRIPTLAIAGVGVRRGDHRVELARSGRIELEPGDRDLRIVARLLSFTDAHAHRYRFLLHGYDTEWVDADAGGERMFASLTPGRYELEVQARTVNGDWSPSQRLELYMPPPWWRTSWAMAIFVVLGLVLMGSAAYAYKIRLKRRHSWQLAKQKQAMAEQASEAKTRFLATLGHEVRTPMTGVLGMSELLLSSNLDQRQRGHVDSIRRAGEHLLRLVNDALDLARIEAGRLQLDTGEFQLQAMIDEVSGLMAPLAERRGLRFERDIEPGLPQVLRGDRTRVMQILMNLLGNAIKFTERGFVSLQAQALPGGGMRFAVSDSGPGLNAEQRERVFRRFEQAEGARTAARYGGSGLGLAISQELAAAMDGRIDVQSTPGEGTRFNVDLPLPASDVEVVTARLSQASVAAATPVGPLRLLLVEDDPTVAEVLTGLLQAQGHTVTHVGHGLAALGEIAARQFDIGLLDLDLPGIDGLALAAQMRTQGFTRPLVAITARADADAEPMALAAGFNHFVRKPLTGAMLAHAIEVALE